MTTESRIFKSFETFLDTSEDIAWLFETHLRAFAALNARPSHDPLHIPFGYAVLHGNTDCPQYIDLRSTSRYDAPVLRFELSGEGDYYVVGIWEK